jgi:hypothetical protein
MEGTLRLLELVRDKKLAVGALRGLFHIAIGRTVTAPDGTVVSGGVTWRALATLLKDAKFDKELVRELGADPDLLAPKDREKMWYHAIGLAKVDSAEARTQADKLAVALRSLGYLVSPASGGPSKLANLGPPPFPTPPETNDRDADEPGEPPPSPKGKKKPKPKK